MKKLLALVLLFVLAGCAPSSFSRTAESDVVVSGIVKSNRTSSWEYGSHLLVNPRSGDRFALTSKTIDLSQHVESGVVTIHGTFVGGYPVGGGPPFIRVHFVTEP